MKKTNFQKTISLCFLIFFVTFNTWASTCTQKGWTKVGPDLSPSSQIIIDIQEDNAGVVHRIKNEIVSPFATTIQKFIASSWIDIPFPFANAPTKIAFDSSNHLYVLNGQTLYQFDGTVWQLIGTTNSTVQDFIINSLDELFIGGLFTQVNGVSANYIAKWDGSSWSSLSSGLSSPVSNGGAYTVTWDAGSLYVGGRFDNASGTAVSNIARWDGTSWNPVGAGISNDVVYDIVVDNLVFTLSQSSSLNTYADVYNGFGWTNIISGVSIGIADLEINAIGELILGSPGSIPLPSLGPNCALAKYNGTSWSCFAQSDASIQELYINAKDDIYIGGALMSYIDQLSVVDFAKYTVIPENSSLDFDGVDDFVAVSSFLSQFAFTTSAWFKASSIPNGGAEDRIFAYGGDTRFEVGLNNSGQLWAFDADRGITSSYGVDLRDDQWHHVAITKTGPSRAIYLDGIQLEVWISPTTVLQYGPDFRIGNWTGSSAANAFFKGEIADVRAYDFAMTPTQIQTTMHCQLSGNETNLRAWWSFEDGVPLGNNIALTQTSDFSPNTNTGTLIGFSLTGNSSNFVCADQDFLFDHCCGASDLIDPIQEFCPADITVSTDPGRCDALLSYTLPTFMDNCDGSALSGTLVSGGASNTYFIEGSTTVIYEYVDANGNGPAQCSFTITVNDTENPVLNCPNQTVTVLSPMLLYPSLYVSFTDNCQISFSSLQFVGVSTPFPYDCSYAGSTFAFSVTGQDISGNSANCIVNLTFDDCYGKCCPSTLVAQPKPDPACAWTATDKIISSQPQLYGNVHYKAGTAICLLPGFDATGADSFIAEIETCN